MRLKDLFTLSLAGLLLAAVLSASTVARAQQGGGAPAASATGSATAPAASATPHEPGPAAPPAASGEKEKQKPWLGRVNDVLNAVLLFDVAFGAIEVDKVDRNGQPVLDEHGNVVQQPAELPFLVVVLTLGSIFFALWYRFINVRGFRHAIDIVRGKYDNPEDEGEISHFRALTSALSATVGLGNIAGVAVAIMQGGPGAVLWMIVIACFGMTAKFSSCTLSQLFRQVNKDGSISGGPMYYLDLGLRQMRLGTLGKILGVTYAVCVMGGALGGGNMFQANQTVEALISTFGFKLNEIVDPASGQIIDQAQWDLLVGVKWGIGITMATLVAAVILGGIKRIGAATSKIVPAMVGIYVLASIFVIIANIHKLPEALSLIWSMAFSGNAMFGGLLGVMVMGIRRAAFSNEAGLGSAAIAHAAAKTDEPVREGMVAMLGPFIDTIIVCLMTAMVVIITGAWSNPELTARSENVGASVTTYAFSTVIDWFPYVLTTSIALFAYSTMISWCYYGERGWIYLLDHYRGMGLRTVTVFRVIFVIFVVVGAVNKLGEVMDFSDMMILSMAFPNIIGSVIMAPKVLEKVRDYWRRYQSGEMKPYQAAAK